MKLLIMRGFVRRCSNIKLMKCMHRKHPVSFHSALQDKTHVDLINEVFCSFFIYIFLSLINFLLHLFSTCLFILYFFSLFILSYSSISYFIFNSVFTFSLSALSMSHLSAR
jgi:hypothetical protein